MKSFRIVAFLIGLFFNIGFAQDIQELPSFMSKIREQDIQLKETILSILNIDCEPFTHLVPEQIEVVKETLEKWAKSLLLLNQLSLELFNEGLTDRFLESTAWNIKKITHIIQELKVERDNISELDPKHFKFILIPRIKEIYLSWRGYEITGDYTLKGAISNYLMWKFALNIFPKGRRSADYYAPGCSDLYKDFFKKIDQYVKDYQSGKTTKTLKSYFDKEVSRIRNENEYASKKLTNDENYFLSAFNGLERYINVIPKKNKSPKEL